MFLKAKADCRLNGWSISPRGHKCVEDNAIVTSEAGLNIPPQNRYFSYPYKDGAMSARRGFARNCNGVMSLAKTDLYILYVPLLGKCIV